MNKFMNQARFAHPGLTDNRHDLTMTAAGVTQCLGELLNFQFATDKGRQPARSGSLQFCPLKAPFGDLEDFNRMLKSLNRHFAE